MSKEKQIEEMARELCPLAVDKECKDCVFEKWSITCNPKTYAKRSINAGYRRQSEGEWLTDTEYYDDDYSECNVRKVFACSRCGRTERRKEPYCHCGAKMKGASNEK